MNHGREITLGVGSTILFACVLFAARDWKEGTALFPVVIGTAGLVLSLWAVGTDIMQARRVAVDEGVTLTKEDRTRTRAIFAWIGLFFAAIMLFGFQWGLPVTALAFYRFDAQLGWVASLLTAAVCAGFIYAASHFLHIPPFSGYVIAFVR